VEPDIAIRLFVAMSALPLLILQVKAQKIADCCICRGDLPVVDLLATLVQQADGIVLIRRFRKIRNVPALRPAPYTGSTKSCRSDSVWRSRVHL
jgi:hypothetical protein